MAQGGDLNFNLALGNQGNQPLSHQQQQQSSSSSQQQHEKFDQPSQIKVDLEEPGDKPIQRSGLISRSAHPVAAIFHIFFKALALISYFVVALFVDEIPLFIITIFLFAFDFWTVKNVTGRLLVGLKWWSEIDQQGNQNWKFQSLFKSKSNSCDKTFFWLVLYGSALFWLIWAFLKLISLAFFNFNLCLIGFLLSFTNVVGYYKCQKDHQKKAKQFVQKQALRSAVNWLPGLR